MEEGETNETGGQQGREKKCTTCWWKNLKERKCLTILVPEGITLKTILVNKMGRYELDSSGSVPVGEFCNKIENVSKRYIVARSCNYFCYGNSTTSFLFNLVGAHVPLNNFTCALLPWNCNEWLSLNLCRATKYFALL